MPDRFYFQAEDGSYAREFSSDRRTFDLELAFFVEQDDKYWRDEEACRCLLDPGERVVRISEPGPW
jgi:hypothetical protein